MNRIGLANLTLLLLLGGAVDPGVGHTAEVLGTGLCPPTKEELARLAPYLRQIRSIHLTPLGRQRMLDDTARPNGGGVARRSAALVSAETAVRPFGQDLVFEGAAAARGITAQEMTVPLPVTVDNSLLDAFPPIGNQGSLGSCAAFSTTYYQLTFTLAMQRGWNARSGGNAYRMSPKWTYNLLNGGYDGGVSREGCLGLAVGAGCASWAELPYDGSDYRSWVYNNVNVWRNALDRRLACCGTISDIDSDNGLYRLKQLLNNGHILTFGTYVTSWIKRTIPNDPSTADDDPYVNQKVCPYVDGSAGPHAMTIVGYCDAIWCDINLNGQVDAGEKGALKIANQWGTGDWNGGFRWLAYDALREASIVPGISGPANRREAIMGATWVVAQAEQSRPRVGVYTIHHSKRAQVSMAIGIGATNVDVPVSSHTIYPVGGGNFGFDGNSYDNPTSAPNGTFAVAMETLDAAPGSIQRLFLGMKDSAYAPEVGQILSFHLEDEHGNVLATSSQTPVTVDGIQAWVWVDYQVPVAGTVVSLSVPDPDASEAGPDNAIFRISRTGDTTAALDVAVTVDGSATEGQDFIGLPRLVTIAAGATFADVVMTPLDDWRVEPDETVQLSLLQRASYQLGAVTSATAVITSDDTVSVRMLADECIRIEEGTSKTVLGVLTAPPTTELTLTAVKQPSNYCTFQLDGAPVVIHRDAANWDVPFALTISVPDNTTVGGFSMGSMKIYGEGVEETNITINEIDNETPQILVEPDLLQVQEGTTSNLWLRYTMAPAQPTTLEVHVANGAVNVDPDLVLIGNTNLVFDATNWSAWQSVAIQALEDADAEDGQTEFAVRLVGQGWDEFSFTVFEKDNDTPSNPDNQAPTIISSAWVAPNPVTLPDTAELGVTASDPDGDTLAYTWSTISGPGAVGFTPNGSGVSDFSTASFSAAGSYILRVSVADGKGGSVTSDVSVVVSTSVTGPGDLNGDGLVNIDDLVLVTSHFGQSAGDWNWDARSDANGDGVVNITDLTLVTLNFGNMY